MQVRMMNQRLSPRVQHTQETDLRAEAFGIRRYFQQRGRSAAEQQIVEDALVLEHQFREWMGHGEHDVEIVQRDQFAGTRRDPAVACLDLTLGAVAIAASNGDLSITCLGLNRYAVFGWHDLQNHSQ